MSQRVIYLVPRQSALAFIVLKLACLPLVAAESLPERIDALVQPYLDNEIVVGLTIGVVHEDEQGVFGYGRMTMDGDRAPDGDTVYEIGSVSKIFTGLLLADAITQENAELDQAAGALLPPGMTMPHHEQRGHESRAITLLDLATHVSGLPSLPDNMAMENPHNPYADFSIDELHGFLNGYQLTRAPGDQTEYSNLGMGLLGNLLAYHGESDYETLLRKRVTTPLKMSSTSVALDQDQQPRLAAPHLGDGQATSNWDLPALVGAGGIRSTANDMLRLAQANLSPPENDLGKAIELAWQIHQPPITPDGFAMGLDGSSLAMATHAGTTARQVVTTA